MYHITYTVDITVGTKSCDSGLSYPYLVNNESRKSYRIYLTTTLIFEDFSMKMFLVFIEAEE